MAERITGTEDTAVSQFDPTRADSAVSNDLPTAPWRQINTLAEGAQDIFAASRSGRMRRTRLISAQGQPGT